jgi:hypothetical protein
MKASKSNRGNRTRSMSDPAVILRSRVTFQPPRLEAGSQNESHTDVSPDSVLVREVIPLLSATKLEAKFEAGSQNENSYTSDASLYFQHVGSPIPISGSSHNLQFPHSSVLDVPHERRLNSSMPRRAQSPETSRKNRSHTDNEAGSAEEDGVREYILAIPRTKKISPQLKDQFKEIPKKIKLKNSKNSEYELWEPGMDAGSQTEDKEPHRSPKEASSISGPEHNSAPIPHYKRSPGKSLSKQQLQFEELFTTTAAFNTTFDSIQEIRPLKKSNKDVKTTLPREFSPRSAKKETKRTSLGHKSPSVPKGIEKKRTLEIMPSLDAGSERDLSEPSFSSANNYKPRYTRDFGTTAASIGNDSAPFELKFEAEIAYFQNNFDMKDVLLSSDTDGSKAISEGSSTAEGAASAAEGYFDIYHYLQSVNQTNST